MGDAPTASERLCRPKLVLESRCTPDESAASDLDADGVDEEGCSGLVLADRVTLIPVGLLNPPVRGEEKMAIRDSGRS